MNRQEISRAEAALSRAEAVGGKDYCARYTEELCPGTATTAILVCPLRHDAMCVLFSMPSCDCGRVGRARGRRRTRCTTNLGDASSTSGRTRRFK